METTGEMKRKNGETFDLTEVESILKMNVSPEQIEPTGVKVDEYAIECLASKLFFSGYGPYYFHATNRGGDIYFINLPKCAGNFVSYYSLWDGLPVRSINHYEGRRYSGDVIKEDFYFVVVRNPFDFWVSLFFWEKDNYYKELDYWNEREREKERHSTEPEKIKYHFNNFIEWSYEHWRSDKNTGILSISENYKTYCFSEDGVYLPNRVCKFESLHEDVGGMFESLGFDNAIENIKKHCELDICKNKSKHKKYTEYYNKSSIEKVTNMEKYILEKYNYTYG